jgi:hypothetical protein
VHPQVGGLRLVVLRCASVGVAAVALAALHLAHRPPTLCLLRAVTGVPCPFCGGTTAAVALGGGHVPAALAASPLAGVVALAWLADPVVARPAWWADARRRRAAVLAALLASELWQLHRFGLLGA